MRNKSIYGQPKVMNQLISLNIELSHNDSPVIKYVEEPDFSKAIVVGDMLAPEIRMESHTVKVVRWHSPKGNISFAITKEVQELVDIFVLEEKSKIDILHHELSSRRDEYAKLATMYADEKRKSWWTKLWE